MYSLRKIFNPALFQGSMNKSNYFEGWYLKHVTAGNQDAFAVIPGISLSTDPHAFIQFSDGSTGRSAYFRYDLSDFHADKKRFEIRIGNSIFSSDGIGLDLDSEELKVTGKIDYSDMATLQPTLLRPGIMGWYSYVPGMECNHGVVSLNHFLAGSIYINGRQKVYSGGKGYIEKDWGTSFPESWIWLQCNSFRDEYISIMISAAKIPWRGSFFPGLVAYIHFRGKTEIFATYNKSKILYLKKTVDQKVEMLIEKGKKRLKLVIAGKDGIPLATPVEGKMINRIKESINSVVNIKYSDGDKIIYSGTGIKAGFEETEGIYKYF